MGEKITFAVAAIGALGFGAGVVFFRDAFRAAVSLIGALLAVALLFIALLAPFAAAVQVIVYAGAIVVMFLFVIAYLGERGEITSFDRLDRWQVVGWLGVLGLGGLGAVAVLASDFGPDSPAPATTGVGVAAGNRRGHAGQPHRGLAGHRGDHAHRHRGRRDPGQERGAGGGRPVNVPIEAYLMLSLGLLVLGLIGVMRRRNPLMLLLSVELMLNAGNVSLIGFSRLWDDPSGQVFALVVMVVAAAEVVIGLGLVVAIFRSRSNLDVDELSSMKG